ncbi:hypothetical protein TKK_0010014 [Trichogramma kaykai]
MSPTRQVLLSTPVSGALFTIQFRKSALEFLVGGDVIKSFDRYERCHVEWWEVENGEEAPICGRCGRPTDTPGDYVYDPFHK